MYNFNYRVYTVLSRALSNLIQDLKRDEEISIHEKLTPEVEKAREAICIDFWKGLQKRLDEASISPPTKDLKGLKAISEIKNLYGVNTKENNDG